MKNIIVTALLCAGLLLSSVDDEWIVIDGHQASATQLVIKFNANSAPQLGLEAPLTLDTRTDIAQLLSDQGLTEFRPLFTNYDLFTRNHRDFELHQYYVVRFLEPVDIPVLMNEIYSLPDIENVEPDHIAHAVYVPNDPYYPDQWGHNNTGQAGSNDVGVPDCDTDTDQAWDITQGESEIIVAILDTGINGNHEEFVGKMVPGYDFVNNDYDASDDNGHGTACAGIAAARGDNGIGIAGVSWESGIMPIKVLNSGGSGSTTDIADGVTWASDNGARIISMSLSGGGFDGYFDNAINYAVANGTVVFAATGNDNNGTCGFPSAYDNCIAVGALSPCNERKNPNSCDGESWWGSNYGEDLDFLAPGVLINATSMNGGYTSSFNGTSSACPHAAGIGALVLSAEQSLSPDQVRDVMRLTCDDLYQPGFDNESGYGRLNAFGSVSYSMSHPELTLLVESVEFQLDAGQSEMESILLMNSGDDDLTYSIDPFGYNWTDSDGDYISYEWIDIEGIGTQFVFPHNDHAADPIDIGFDFSFYEEMYAQCIVNANGWIGFGEDNTEWSNTVLPNPDAPRPAIFGYWDDLNPNNDGGSAQMDGEVYYHSNNDRLVVWFDDVVHWYGSNEIEGTYDFQMVLYADGRIRYNYRDVEGELSLATIGIQDGAAEQAVLINYNLEYVHDELSVLIQARPDWLSLDPMEAVIPPGDGIEFNITVNTAGLNEGEYFDWIVLDTNDFANLHPEITIWLTVSGSACDEWLMGDINNDGVLNVMDVVTIVNVVIGELTDISECQTWVSDYNADGLINVLDILQILNVIME